MILTFKQKTKPHHDSIRQVSRSETPSIKLWHHYCQERKGQSLALGEGCDCPFCGINLENKK